MVEVGECEKERRGEILVDCALNDNLTLIRQIEEGIRLLPVHDGRSTTGEPQPNKLNFEIEIL